MLLQCQKQEGSRDKSSMKKKEKQHQQTEGWFEKAVFSEGKKCKWFDVEVSFQDGVRIIVATRRPELRCV